MNPAEEDAVAAARAGTDQMTMIYRTVWIPFFADLDTEMTNKVSDKVRDAFIIDLHRKFLGPVEVER